ncbi:MAG: single-stranded-DNA-specific exonuclease RecJ [Sphaerochaetaceae bacterium]|jgi:single-stranded-DNA-specific exonuclease|nr:single-stranded-DNA-specific exonuclease RecJ [Sphaerochaetaceae bacterium]MDD3366333.1 single-stranded-DNA-specific exonuclease RecJ [Sphaerochaetaceae bacterium]MDD4218719.1 single-stranded-DNA-specific exonuclease RecJ [Sphaerochaetaceae bacterium]MDY0371145.1 single-stranded-DNA-specific exonuclease RecJ [Sphaerochaetaceae bacterium]
MKEWKKEPVSVELVRKLNETYNVDYITASLLIRRGATEPETVKFFLETDVSYLHNPFLFDEMENFVERVLQARQEGEKVCVFGDRDVDGITSTVLLVQELRAMGIDTTWRLPQGDEPYGLTRLGLEEAAAQHVTLIITVDCGISNIEEVAYAHQLGLSVLVTDHHLSGDAIPAAEAVINPKIEGCGYPFSHLAGCGVVAKCIWALRFAQTDFFREECVLVHAYPGNTTPGNETIIMEAVRLKNLIVEDRIIEEVVPGLVQLHQSRMIKFLDCGLPLLALDVEVETKLFRRAFGTKAEIHLGELRTQFEQILPQVKGKTLFSLMRKSRSIRYSQTASELDLLISLFQAYVLRKEPSLSFEYENILDLVALGTIGDLMPMLDENRILVRTGMKKITQGNRQELLPLLSMQNLVGKKLSTSDVGWQITPIINASGRLGRPEVAANMLLAENLQICEEYASELVGLNRERQRQGDVAWSRLLHKAQSSHTSFDGKFLMVEDNEVHRGLTGIMASRLLRQFKTPSLVVAHVGEQRVTGSMRSPKYFDVREFLHSFTDLFIDFGGHRCAGGFSMDEVHLPELRKRITTMIDEFKLHEDLKDEIVTIDAELPANYLTPEIITLVESFEPFGEGNPPLQFLIQGAKVEEIQFLNRSKGSDIAHVKLQLHYGQYRWPALYWNASDEVGTTFNTNDSVDVVFRMGRNYFRNNETLQLTVISLKKHKTPIEQIIKGVGQVP